MSWDIEVKKEGGGDFEVPPEGNWGARLAAIIDVGSHEAHGQDGSAYQRRTTILAFELACKKKDGSPFFIARTVTLSLALNTNLYSVVKTLSGPKSIGERFDPAWIAGKGCLVQIAHSTKQKGRNTRTYANIEAVTALPQGMPFPAGGCVVWTITERATNPLPALPWMPPLYHESSTGMRTVSEWVNLSEEVHAEGTPVSGVADARMPAQSPATQIQPDHPAPLANAPPASYGYTQVDPDEAPF